MMERSQFSILDEIVVGNPPRVEYYIQYRQGRDAMFVAAGASPGVVTFVNSPRYKVSFPSRAAADAFISEVLAHDLANPDETVDIPTPLPGTM
jgi:hypothetical protein